VKLSNIKVSEDLFTGSPGVSHVDGWPDGQSDLNAHPQGSQRA